MRLDFTDDHGRTTAVNPAHVVRVRKQKDGDRWRVAVVDTHGWIWWFRDLTEDEADARMLSITDHWA